MPPPITPATEPMATIGFIGAGRVAATLAMAWSAAGIPVCGAASRDHESARRLVQQCHGPSRPVAYPDAQSLAEHCDLIFLTVPDAAIEATARSLRWRPGQAVVHCSAATEVAALGKAAADGAATGGFHPLQLFSTPEIAVKQLAGAGVAIEAEGKLLSVLEELAAVLRMRPFHLPAGARVRYHVAGNIAASGILALLKEAADIWTRCGLPREAALPALLPLTRGTLAAAAEKGLAAALAGPVSRGDIDVIERHLAALDAAGEDRRFYAALLMRQLMLAEESGRVTAPEADRIRRLGRE